MLGRGLLLGLDQIGSPRPFCFFFYFLFPFYFLFSLLFLLENLQNF
jgi:hypothetical protein